MKTRWISLASLVLVVLFSLVNCTPKTGPAPVDTGISHSTPALTISPENIGEPAQPQAQLPTGDVSIESVKLASQDLAQRLGISVESISVAAVIGEEFSTVAFYCRTTKDRIAKDDPPAGISGFSILLSASGRRYEYHASGQTVIFCRPLS